MLGLRKFLYKRIRRVRRRPVRSKIARARYEDGKERARALVHERIAYFAPRIGVTPGRIAIRDQRSRWGSCSTKGNLNFNYRIALIPIELTDYIIVHELCHLLEFNHGEAFWKLVEAILPDYKLRKDALHILSSNGILVSEKMMVPSHSSTIIDASVQ